MWNPNKQIERMQPSVTKLLAHLKTKGINFSPEDVNGFDNVTFSRNGKEIKMAKHSLYRYSGISVFTKDKGDNTNQTVVIPVTDDMYMNLFMKPIIETLMDNA
jgi:hypothetical protein